MEKEIIGVYYPNFLLITDKSSIEDTKNIISKPDSKKARGDDKIGIRKLKLCDKSICKPLNIIFKSCLPQGIFPSEPKLQNCLSSPNL